MINSSVNSIAMVPVQQSLGPTADAQGSDDVASSARSVPSTASAIGNRRVGPHTQQLNVVSSAMHITASQPLPRRVASVIHDEETASSQSGGNDHILNSTRRTRSRGLVNTYRMSYSRQGFELS